MAACSLPAAFAIYQRLESMALSVMSDKGGMVSYAPRRLFYFHEEVRTNGTSYLME